MIKNSFRFILCCAFFLTACGQAVAQLVPAEATSSPDEANPQAAPTKAPAVNFPENSAIVYEVSGGIAGISEKWTIYLDGQVVSEEGSRRLVTTEQVTELLSQVEAKGFFELNDRYVPFDTCCDRFLYTISVQYNGKYHQVTMLEATPDTPQSVWDILAAVQRLIEGAVVQ